MGRFNENSLLKEVMKDPEAKRIVKKAFPLAVLHPRFNEAFDFSLKEIISDDMGTIVGLSNEKIEAVFRKIYELE